MTIDFKGCHYLKDVILYAVFFYVRYAVSYRDLEEIIAERGVQADHATLNRWVVKYPPNIAKTPPHKTSANWPRFSLHRSKRAKPDKKGARVLSRAPLSAAATRCFYTKWRNPDLSCVCEGLVPDRQKRPFKP